MIGVGVAAFALVMVVAYLVTKPFLAPEADGMRSAQLRDDRARSLGQLRDLEMEFETGKLADDEFEASRSRRLEEIALADEALADLDAEVDGEATPDGEETPTEDRDVEQRIAARKVALEGATCPRCAKDIDIADSFCRSCGAPLDAAGTR